MYEYEYITDNSKEYLDKIYQIEDLKEELKNALNCSGIIENDIYETNKLEGNQLTREETDDFLLNDITIRGKSFRDYAQISNFTCVLDAAKNWVYNQENAELSIDMILIMHHMIIANELSQNESGIFRDNAVHIRTTSYIPPDATFVSDYMQELVDKYNQTIESTKTSFEKICEFKRNFERIHPFFDGNGRTGRLIMNMLFLKNGYSYISFPAEERDIYFQSLENNTFHMYAADKMIDSLLFLKEQEELNRYTKMQNSKENDHEER